MKYKKPRMEVLRFGRTDVVCASEVDPTVPEDSSDGSGDWDE